MNWLDFIIFVTLILFMVDGVRRGFIVNGLELLGFIISLAVAFFLFEPVGSFLNHSISMPLSFSKVVGFLIIWLLIDIAYSIILFFIYKEIPEEIRKNRWNLGFGFLPAFLKGLVFLAIILAVLLSAPLGGEFQDYVKGSYLGARISGRSGFLNAYYKRVFGGAVDDIVTFFTVKQGSEESVQLKSKPTELSIDANAEDTMFSLINGERIKNGLEPLMMDDNLREVARAHSRDMFERGYFSHVTLDGLDPFDRLKAAGIRYAYAGENLALAPDVYRAHEGLMNSPGHRENILTPEYRKIGIGVIDGGVYGKMFSQEFTD